MNTARKVGVFIQLSGVHNIAIDSMGNLYTAEVDTGKRLQRFTPVR